MTFLSHAGGHLDLSRIYKLIWNRLTMKSPWDIWVGILVISIRLSWIENTVLYIFSSVLGLYCTSVAPLLFNFCTSVLLLLYTPTPNWEYIITKIGLADSPHQRREVYIKYSIHTAMLFYHTFYIRVLCLMLMRTTMMMTCSPVYDPSSRLEFKYQPNFPQQCHYDILNTYLCL